MVPTRSSTFTLSNMKSIREAFTHKNDDRSHPSFASSRQAVAQQHGVRGPCHGTGLPFHASGAAETARFGRARRPLHAELVRLATHNSAGRATPDPVPILSAHFACWVASLCASSCIFAIVVVAESCRGKRCHRQRDLQPEADGIGRQNQNDQAPNV